MSWYKKNHHLFLTDYSRSQISINSVKCKLDFFWLVEVNVKILNKLQHTSTIYSDSVDLQCTTKVKFRIEIQTLHQSIQKLPLKGELAKDEVESQFKKITGFDQSSL